MVLLVHMADRRRLQGEIDKTLKKVNEGVDAFDDVWQKLVIVSRLPVQTATNINQKEKYESELKKEIKKLQRLREQIKTWQSSNEIKDKKPLLEARKNIEQQMERFKVIERETKQKPYSKDALGGAYKFDPLHKEQEDLREWLQSCNNKLNSKVDELETRLEDLNANKKKRMDKEKIEITKTSLETHRHYMETLERIGTMLQKQQLSVKKVQEIKYDIDDFIENSDQPEYSINPDLFEELELDKYDSASAQNDSDDDDEEDDDDDEDDDEDEDDDDEEEEETVNNGKNSSGHNNNNNRNRNRAGSSSGSSASSTSSSVPANNEGNTNGTLSTEEDKRRRHKSESGVKPDAENNRGQQPSQNNQVNNNNKRSNGQHSNNQALTTTTNRTRTNSGVHTSGSSSGSTSSSLSNFSSTSKDNKIPPFNQNNLSETNHSSNNLIESQIPPPLSQSPFAAVVAGTANPNQAPVSFSAAVSTNTANSANNTQVKGNANKQQQQSSINTLNSQTSKEPAGLSTSPKDSISNTALFLSQQQQQLSNLIAAANGSITSLSQLNGLVLPTELDKKLSDVVLNNSSSTIPPGVSVNNNNGNASMNSLKSMAENAILNLTPQQQQQQAGSLSSLNTQLSNLTSNFLNNNSTNNNTSSTEIASLLATLQQQPGGLSVLTDPNDPNTAAALANLIAQQKGNLNLPSALSALQQQQFNEQQSRIGLSVQSNGTSNVINNSQSTGQGQNISPSLLMNQGQLNNGNTTNQETFIQPILGVAPLGKTPLSKDQNQQLIILESAFKKLPHPSDTERMRNYLPRILINTPSYYPMSPPNGHDSIDFLNKLTSDSLFFMFYYMEGTKAQFLAAQALKKLSWRFHTRYMMWFQRFEEPKVITDEYEMGTYVYFDFEKWGQRKKEGFTFEYKYLEDRDLSSY